jgi:hypothetical protein
MDCNCKNTEGFKQKLKEAKNKTDQTGEVHVVFVLNKVIFVCKETDLSDDLGIYCYFLADGTEKPYTQAKTQEIIGKIKAKKNVKDIEVTSPIIEESEQTN